MNMYTRNLQRKKWPFKKFSSNFGENVIKKIFNSIFFRFALLAKNIYWNVQFS